MNLHAEVPPTPNRKCAAKLGCGVLAACTLAFSSLSCSRQGESFPPRDPTIDAMLKDRGIALSYYPVPGKDLLTVHSNMLFTCGTYFPNESENIHKTAIAYTYLTWKSEGYDGVKKPKEFDPVASVSILLTTTVILPHPSELARFSDRERRIWTTEYFPALARHEAGHHEIGLKARDSLELTLRARLANKEVPLTFGELDQLGQSAVRKMRGAHHSYDEQTQHGREQGATLTPYTGIEEREQ